MKSNRLFIPFLVGMALSGCGGSGGGADSATATSDTTTTTTATTLPNTMTITVNGSLCSSSTSGSYPNKPCVSVTVCTPGTSTCQTINDILLDTGSYGLRIFSSALAGVSLTQVSSGSGSLAECVQFGDGSSLWGPVQTADVVLGSESAVRTPIQVINAGFGSRPSACGNADTTPVAAGFNGILGVGLFAYDCGTACANSANNGMYYACSGTSCTGTRSALSLQVQNPVALLPEDNNGVIVQLPGVATGGAASATGSLILGIGTRTNNTPSAVTMYPVNQSAEFTTTFGGTTYDSFLDTGSNGLFFTAPSSAALPECSSSSYSGWFCPPSTTSFTAVNTGSTGSPSAGVTFRIGNAGTLLGSSNNVFSELGGSYAGEFDWGLPFFLGRSVYVGIDGTGSSLGTGPYWAY